MLRDKHYHRDKQLLALFKELKRLQRIKDTMKPVEPPIQRGWVRRWRLTKSASLRSDAPVLRIILQGINTEMRSWRRSFKPGKRWDRSAAHHITGQTLRELTEWDWRRFGWPADWQSRYFRRHDVAHRSSELKVLRFTFRLEGIFELYVDRYFVFEMRALDPAVESRMAQIESTLGPAEWGRICWLHGNRCYLSGTGREDYFREIDQRVIRAALRGEDVEARWQLIRPSRISVPGKTFTMRASANSRPPDFHSGNTGANPVALANYIHITRHESTASSNSLGLCALHTGIRVQLPVRLPFQVRTISRRPAQSGLAKRGHGPDSRSDPVRGSGSCIRCAAAMADDPCKPRPLPEGSDR
jgi:hypothetical protein